VSDSTELAFDIADEKLLTIGTVVERLRGDFPDVSVSKLRYLEEQHLISPQRTKSGYRLFSQDDYRRLIRVLTMQRDEYLPLKVIRRELERGGVAGAPRQGLRKADLVASGDERLYTAEEVQSITGADGGLLAELEEYELVKGRQISGVRRYS
jgi:DNA-binding transcriptional MerR regulator